MKKCPYCNEKLSDNANFCHNCGEKYKIVANLVINENKPKTPTQKELNDLADIFEVQALPDGTFAIFEGVGKFETYEVPYFVSEIECDAFTNIRGLREVTIGDNVKVIDINAFGDEIEVINITLSEEAMQSIAEQTTDGGLEEMFPYVDELNFTISNQATIIPERIFASLDIIDIEIPDSVEIIGERAFENCEDLESVTFGNSVRIISANAFENCYDLEDLEFPDSLEVIEEFAFAGCDNLSELNFPNSLREIGDGAFSGCSYLETVNFGENIESISEDAFEDCDDITYVTIKENTPLNKRDLAKIFPEDCDIERLDN